MVLGKGWWRLAGPVLSNPIMTQGFDDGTPVSRLLGGRASGLGLRSWVETRGKIISLSE